MSRTQFAGKPTLPVPSIPSAYVSPCVAFWSTLAVHFRDLISRTATADCRFNPNRTGNCDVDECCRVVHLAFAAGNTGWRWLSCFTVFCRPALPQPTDPLSYQRHQRIRVAQIQAKSSKKQSPKNQGHKNQGRLRVTPLQPRQKQEENSQKRPPGQLWSSAEMPSVVLRSPFMAEIMISRLLFVEPPAQTRRKLLY